MEKADIDPRITYESWSSESPVETEGAILGNRFYFYARFDRWLFCLTSDAVDPGILAFMVEEDLDAIQASDHPYADEVIAAFHRSFIRTADYGPKHGFDASSMPRSEAKAITRTCVAEYYKDAEPPPEGSSTS